MEDNNIKTEENKIWEGSQEVGCHVFMIMDVLLGV